MHHQDPDLYELIASRSLDDTLHIAATIAALDALRCEIVDLNAELDAAIAADARDTVGPVTMAVAA